jgi:2-(1,2-epoxy-1,2-dihydrophenyl)acetyl-CoA isomerase
VPDVLYERRGPTALITLNRPDSLNAFRIPTTLMLLEALGGAARDATVRVIVLTGAGRGFCSGGDIAFMQEVVASGGRFEDFRPLVEAGREITSTLQNIEKPVIAAVNGVAAGGGMSLALACDIRWASEEARFAQSFIRIGLHPDWGALHTLPRLVGMSRALELMWTGDAIDAAEALRIGLVSRVLLADSLLSKTLSFADRLAQAPAVALLEIKRSVRRSLGYTLEESLAREIDAQERCWNTRDAREGFAAFLAKRDPHFQGR